MNKVQPFTHTQDIRFFYWTRFFCYKSSLWSAEAVPSQYKTNLSVLVLLFCPIMLMLESAQKYNEGDTVDAIMSAVNGLAALVCCYKYIVLINVHAKKIENFNQEIELCAAEYKNQDHIRKSEKIYRMLFWIGLIIANASIILYLILPLTISGKKLLPFQPLSPIDLSVSPLYEFVYLYEITSALLCTNITILFDTMFCGSMSLCACLLASAADDLNLNSECNSFDNLKIAVNRLIRIRRFVRTVSEIYSIPSLSHFLYTCGILSFVLYNISVLPVSDFRFITMIVSIQFLMFTLGIYCYFGQDIATKTIYFRESLYNTKWYVQSKDYKRLIILSLQITQTELHVTGGKVLPLTMESFALALRAAYSFYAFLINFN